MKVNHKQIAAAGWIFCLLPMLSFADPVRSAAEPDYPPFSIVNPDGQADGFSVELLRAVLTEMGREVVFETGPWAQIKTALAEGSLDVLPLVGRTPEREEIYDFTIPYMTLHGALFIRNDNTEIQGLSDLQGKRIAVMKGDNAEEYVRRAALSDRIITTSSFEDAFRMLSDGRADAVISQKLMGISLLKELGLKNIQVRGKPNEEFKQNFCFAVEKGNAELLSVLNEGLSIINAKGIQRQLLHKWVGNSAQDALRARIIIYGGDWAYPPYEFLDDKGRPSGFNIDLVRAIAKETGVEIVFQLESWNEIRQKMYADKIDMISMTYSNDKTLPFQFSIPHSVLYTAVFSRMDSPPYKTLADLKNFRVAVQNGDTTHDFALAQGLEKTLTTTESIEDALSLLANGKVDFAIGYHTPGLYWIHENGWKNLRAVDSVHSVQEYCFVVQNDNKALLDLFNEGLQQLKQTGEYRQIYNKWLAVLDPARSLKIKIRYFLIALTVVALLAAFITMIILGLKRQVRKRTDQLRKSNLTLKESQLAALNIMEDAIAAKDRMEGLQAGLKKSEQEFRNSQNLLKDILNTIPVRVFWKDMNLDYLGCNMAFARDAGFSDPSELIGKNDRQLVWKDQAERYNADDRRVLAGEARIDVEEPQTTPEGKSLILLTSKVPLRNAQKEIIGMLGAYMDITGQRQLEEQFRQAQKMDAVGRLAGGVAHDFNNMLQVILGYTEIAITTVGPDSPIAEDLQIILNAGLNSSTLTKQLLTFARKEVISPKVMDLNHVISDMLKMLKRLIGEAIELSWHPGDKLPPVRLDPSQVNQIVANLCINARDAIDGVGQITLKTTHAIIDPAFCIRHPEAAPGEYVCLTVSDDGSGMDRETLVSIFEPFFTTKKQGKGTGLGLATVYGIVKQNNGFIQAESELGRGTQFMIYLPQIVAEKAPSPIVREVEVSRGRGETILLVEDESELRLLCNKFLGNLGYTVLSAETPTEALALFSKHQEDIQLLLTDVIMPEMNGRQLAERIQEIQPDIKVLFMSGYAQGVMTDQGVLKSDSMLIAKPFSRTALAKKVSEILSPKD
jgi:two-component system sensor histidine kinase EvgS